MLFLRTSISSLVFILVIWAGNLQAQIANSRWLQGYQKTITGGTIHYHSPQPNVRNALLVRSLDERDFIEWKSAAMPLNLNKEYITFIWIFGMDVDRNPHGYNLYINGQKWFRFSNPKTSSIEEIVVRRHKNSELRFRVTIIDRHDDVNGIAWCFADFFPGVGIRYLTMGEHGQSVLFNPWESKFVKLDIR